METKNQILREEELVVKDEKHDEIMETAKTDVEENK